MSSAAGIRAESRPFPRCDQGPRPPNLGDSSLLKLVNTSAFAKPGGVEAIDDNHLNDGSMKGRPRWSTSRRDRESRSPIQFIGYKK